MKGITIPTISMPVVSIPVISVLTIGVPGTGGNRPYPFPDGGYLLLSNDTPLLLANEEPILLAGNKK